MSECVVRMEMPTKNTVCELNYYPNGYREWRCVITDKRCDHNKNGKFPSWCPIICKLPEGHGELVDRQAVYEKIKRWQEAGGDIFTVSMLHEFYVMLFTVPVIVPAERREKDGTD